MRLLQFDREWILSRRHSPDRGWIRGLWFSGDDQSLIIAEGSDRHTFGLRWHNLRDDNSTFFWDVPVGEFALAPDLSTAARVELEWRDQICVETLQIRSVSLPEMGNHSLQLRDRFSGLSFSSDSQVLMIASYEIDEAFEPLCEIRRFDCRLGSYLPALPMPNRVKAMAMSRRGDRLITGSEDNRVRIWEYPEHQQLAEWRHMNMIHQVVLSPDERVLASVAGRSAALWDMNENRQIVRLTTHPAPVNDLAFSADGRTLATACLDGAVRLWDVATGQQRQAFDWNLGHAGAVAFSRDGLTIAAGGEQGRVVIWDVDA